jgi:hypothetical protein
LERAGRNLRLHVRGAAGDIQITFAVLFHRSHGGIFCWGPEIEPACSSAKLGDLENQFSADMTSVDHPMPKASLLQRKHFDRRQVDQAAINQMSDHPHRVPSSLKVDNRGDLAKASPLGFRPIALDITVCGHCEDVD